MAAEIREDQPRPIAPYVTCPLGAEPSLQGSRCQACGVILLGTVRVCPHCGARGGIEAVKLGLTGTLYNYTIVHRSLPGVPTPFISAIVNLDGGGVIKGTLVAPENEVKFDMPIKVLFNVIAPEGDSSTEYMAYYFVPQ